MKVIPHLRWEAGEELDGMGRGRKLHGQVWQCILNSTNILEDIQDPTLASKRDQDKVREGHW